MALFTLTLNTGRLRSPIVPLAKLVTANNLMDTMRVLAAGGLDKITLTAEVTPISSSGTITQATSSGVITGIINGVSIPITWATSDTVSAALLAAAINASTDPLVAGVVTATSTGAVVTVSSVKKSTTANAITLSVTGTNATASGARLTGGSNGTSTSFTY